MLGFKRNLISKKEGVAKKIIYHIFFIVHYIHEKRTNYEVYNNTF